MFARKPRENDAEDEMNKTMEEAKVNAGSYVRKTSHEYEDHHPVTVAEKTKELIELNQEVQRFLARRNQLISKLSFILSPTVEAHEGRVQ